MKIQSQPSASGQASAGLISRRGFLISSSQLAAGAALAGSGTLGAGEAQAGLTLGPVGKDGVIGDIIHAPADPALWPAWRKALDDWRAARRKALNYDDALYRRPEFAWAASCYACGFVMLCDETFFDPQQARFTVKEFLEDGRHEFGGYDALVLWHAYPRVGFDDRNQFDFDRDQPGGLEGLRQVADLCHQQDTRVFVDYNPWDTGTRREGRSDLEALVALVKAIEADGIFLDTMNKGAAEFRVQLDGARPGVVLEGEGALPLENLHDHHASWAQWFNDSAVPGVLRDRWFEQRHQQHLIRRWDRDHSGEIHTAWMNGAGIMMWENVFGSWVGWSGRDRSLLRSMLPLQRRYSALFSGGRWTPLIPTSHPEVFASLWEADGLRLWTLVNRSARPIRAVTLSVAHLEDEEYYDLMACQPLENVPAGGQMTLTCSIPPRGLGGFVAGAASALGRDFPRFLGRQRWQSVVRWDPSIEFPARANVLKPAPSVLAVKSNPLPADMVLIPAASFEMKVEFQSRECGFYESQPVGEALPPLHQPVTFRRSVKLRAYALELTPVTNAQFERFLKAAHHKPVHPQNFLKHWQNGAPPPGREEHPVVYVSLEDARAYAAWAGRRLPTEEEWQYAAQGPAALRYPWGNEMKPDCCNDGQTSATTPVRAFPQGRSPFGCYDLCGNVWEWTESERSDGRTRFCILKGGSFYRARGSAWYADGGAKPASFAAKFLLMWPGLDRCATIGFRCAVDAG